MYARILITVSTLRCSLRLSGGCFATIPSPVSPQPPDMIQNDIDHNASKGWISFPFIASRLWYLSIDFRTVTMASKKMLATCLLPACLMDRLWAYTLCMMDCSQKVSRKGWSNITRTAIDTLYKWCIITNQPISTSTETTNLRRF